MEFGPAAAEQRQPGQILFYATKSTEPAGKPLAECELVPVMLDYLSDDDRQAENVDALKLGKARRDAEQAKAQGAYLTHADLGYLLGVSSGVIDRLQARQVHEALKPLPTRGREADMGRAITHRTHIVDLWMQIYTETEIVRRTGHSYSSVENYITAFGRFALLKDRQMPLPMIRKVLSCSMALVEAYEELYQKDNTEDYWYRFELLRARVLREEAPDSSPEPEAVEKNSSAPLLKGDPPVAPRAERYRPLRYKNLKTKLKSHLIRHYEFAKKSRLADRLIELILDALDRDEAGCDVPRVKPWHLVFRRQSRTGLLPLFDYDDLDRYLQGQNFATVRRPIEQRCLRALRTVWPEATRSDLRTIINVRGLTRRGSVATPATSKVRELTPRDRLAEPPKLVDVERFANRVTSRHLTPADGVVCPQVQRRLTQQLDQDYHIPPKLAQMVVDDLAAIRAECLPRLDELQHGQVMVLCTDCYSRIGAASVPEEQRLRPVILTLFTEPERRALASDQITAAQARAIQLKQIVRVHVEAYAQGGLLCYVDSQWLFSTCYRIISQAINAYELRENVFVPTPGTVLDAGNKITHKALAVRLYLDGLTTTEIARRMYHSEQAVDHYVGTFDQVALLYWHEVPVDHMRIVLRRGARLINEYVRLVERYFKDRHAVREYLRSKGIRVA